MIYGSLGLHGAGEAGITAQVAIGDSLQSHHAEIIAHAVAGYHCPGYFRRLLYIVAGTGGDNAEFQGFCGTASGKGGNLVLQLRLRHQVVVAFFLHLHGIAQGA